LDSTFYVSVLTFPLQLGDTSVMQAVLKMGDGVHKTTQKPVPQELQHQHSKVTQGAHQSSRVLQNARGLQPDWCAPYVIGACQLSCCYGCPCS
jgi:hypothetical protein